MRILSWNVALLPRNINILRNPNKVINEIIEKTLQYKPNIINLQEVFDYKLQNKILNILKENKYNVYTSKKTGYLSKNGLLIATKENIINKNEFDYKDYTGPEILIKKGIISVETENYIVHNTHLQSDFMGSLGVKRCRKFRKRQMEEIEKYLINFDKSKLNIVSGDLNEDFESDIFLNFVNNLPFDDKFYNNIKMITYPEEHSQLDYIILNKNVNRIYGMEETDLSDHNIINCEIDNVKNTETISDIISNH